MKTQSVTSPPIVEPADPRPLDISEPTDSSEPLLHDGMIPTTAVEVRDEAQGDGRYLLYDPESEVVLLVNQTARAILALCNGRNTVSQIATSLADTYTAPEGVDIHEAVRAYLTLLVELHLATIS